MDMREMRDTRPGLRLVPHLALEWKDQGTKLPEFGESLDAPKLGSRERCTTERATQQPPLFYRL